MLLNDDIADIAKPDGICAPTSVVNELSGLRLFAWIGGLMLNSVSNGNFNLASSKGIYSRIIQKIELSSPRRLTLHSKE